MNKYVLLAGAAVVAFATSAQALEVSPYAALRGSWAFTRNNLVATTLGGSQKIKLNDGTWGAHVALGAKHGAFRLETEYNTGKTAHKKFMAGRGNDVFKVNLRTESILVNAYWDINLCSRFTPYVSAGAGLAGSAGLAGAGAGAGCGAGAGAGCSNLGCSCGACALLPFAMHP